jgi:CBS domain-containing protein
MEVKDVCKILPSITQEANLKSAAALITQNAVDSLVVIENQKPIAMLSSFELLAKVIEEVLLEDIPVKEVMNDNILVIEAATEIEEAADVMLSHKHWMAIVTEKGDYIGVVTAGGLLKGLT